MSSSLPSKGYGVLFGFGERSYAIEFPKAFTKQTADQSFYCNWHSSDLIFRWRGLPEDIDKYRDTYLKSWDAIRKELSAGENGLGLVN